MALILKFTVFFTFGLQYLVEVYCQKNMLNDFLVEYYRYKAPSMVVGFTCNKPESNFLHQK